MTCNFVKLSKIAIFICNKTIQVYVCRDVSLEANFLHDLMMKQMMQRQRIIKTNKDHSLPSARQHN